MKKWGICLAISLMISVLGLAYFIYFEVQVSCIDSGGSWLGVFGGCDGNSDYSLQYLISPLGIAIFLGIVLGMSSALVQIHSMLFRR